MSEFLLDNGTRVKIRVVTEVGGLKTVTVEADGCMPVSITEFCRDRRLLGLWARVVKNAPFVELRRYCQNALGVIASAGGYAAHAQRSFKPSLGQFWPNHA